MDGVVFFFGVGSGDRKRLVFAGMGPGFEEEGWREKRHVREGGGGGSVGVVDTFRALCYATVASSDFVPL